MQRNNSILVCAAVSAALVMTSVSLQAQTTGGGTTRGSTTGSSTGGASTGGAGTGATGTGNVPSVTQGQSQNVQQSAQFLGAGGSGAFIGLGSGTQQSQGNNRGLQFQSFGQNQNQFRQQQLNTTTRTLPRPQLVIAFDVPNVPAPETTLAVNSVLENARLLPLGEGRFAQVSFAIAADGKVTLNGTVPDSRTSQLAEMLVRLEPGVRSVTNNLAVNKTP